MVFSGLFLEDFEINNWKLLGLMDDGTNESSTKSPIVQATQRNIL
jgi:hypothetical protein